MSGRYEWYWALGIPLAGIILLGVGIYLEQRLTVGSAVAPIAVGAGLTLVGVRSLAIRVAARYGHIRVPAWVAFVALLLLGIAVCCAYFAVNR